MITAERYHDFSAGHRVAGHENKCRHLHGHNYRVHFKCAGELDSVGRVLDFGVIKSKLCMWLEDNWDHKFLAWEEDMLVSTITELASEMIAESIVTLPFNPTAENMADHLLNVVGPVQLKGTGVVLVEVKVEETAKCSATATLNTADIE